MEYRLFALLLRLALAAICATCFALLAWVVGALGVGPFLPLNDFIVTTNLVISLGLGAGIAAWIFGIRLGSDHVPHKATLPSSVGVAVFCAWSGHLLLDDILFGEVITMGIKDAPEVYGALLGAVTGSLLTPVAVGTWRVAHRLEP